MSEISTFRFGGREGGGENNRGDCAELTFYFFTPTRLSLIPSSSNNSTEELHLPLLPTKPTAPLDLLSILLGAKLNYGPTERDLVCLRHEVQTTSSTGEVELFSSTLVQVCSPYSPSSFPD